VQELGVNPDKLIPKAHFQVDHNNSVTMTEEKTMSRVYFILKRHRPDPRE
jgi:hypothetical protein